MASPSWQRSKEVFQAALARAPELRGAFLDEACADDGELRRDVDGLLAAHDAAGGFLAGDGDPGAGGGSGRQPREPRGADGPLILPGSAQLGLFPSG